MYQQVSEIRQQTDNIKTKIQAVPLAGTACFVLSEFCFALFGHLFKFPFFDYVHIVCQLHQRFVVE